MGSPETIEAERTMDPRTKSKRHACTVLAHRPCLATALALLLVSACQPIPEQSEHRRPVPWDDFRPLAAMQEAPTYHLLDGYDPIWLSYVKQGVERARSYWGTYGPTHVWILGNEDQGEIHDDAKQSFLEDYCAWRTANSPRTPSECMPHAERRFFDPIRRDQPEAYLSGIRDTNEPMAELIFINVHKWCHPDDSIADPVLRGIHEYTHVFQHSVGVLPTWMSEGGAVFAEAWLPYLDGKRDLKLVMRHVMENARRVAGTRLSIADMEEIETAPPEVANYHRELAYDTGAWATAFIIHESPTQSVNSLRDEFYPMVAALGWKTALPRYLGMDSLASFYRAFAGFMNRPIKEQLQMLDRLKH
jgi:hypothetical protein